jgi:hypothetical protein
MLIGLAGYARSGKDTLADYLVVFHDYKKVAFAEPMREALVRLNPTIEVGNFKLAKLATAVNVFGWEELKGMSPDIRGLMQRLGTEVGREMFGQNFWVEQTMKRVAEISGNCVVSDVRYPNEAQAIRDAGGIVIKIDRQGVKAANEHSSENALADFEFDIVLRNDGTLDEFVSKATTELASVLK